MCVFEHDVYDCPVCKKVMRTKPYLQPRAPGATPLEMVDRRCRAAQRLGFSARDCPWARHRSSPRRIQPSQLCGAACGAAGGRRAVSPARPHPDGDVHLDKPLPRLPVHERGRSPSPCWRWLYEGGDAAMRGGGGLVSGAHDGGGGGGDTYSGCSYGPGEGRCSSSGLSSSERSTLADFREMYEKEHGCGSEGSVWTARWVHPSPSPSGPGQWARGESGSEARGRSWTARPAQASPSRRSGGGDAHGGGCWGKVGGSIRVGPAAQGVRSGRAGEGEERHGGGHWGGAGPGVQGVRPAQRSSSSRRSRASHSRQSHRWSPAATAWTFHTAAQRYEW